MTDEEPLVSREETVPDEGGEHPLVAREPAAVEYVEGHDGLSPGESEAGRPAGGVRGRRGLALLTVVLLIVLIGLVGWLIYLLTRPTGIVVRGGAPEAGIEPVLTILGPGRGTAPNFKRPMGAAFGADGRIYVADTGNNRVCVFDSSGGFLFEFGGLGVRKPLPGGKFSWSPGKMDYPIGIAVDQGDGSVYVADFRNDQIQHFDSAGKYLASFPDATKPVGNGSSGQDGKGIAVTDVAVAGGRVYATDAYQVLVFGTSGRLIRQFGKPGLGPTDLDHPNGIAVGSDGAIYVSDSNHARVIAFDATGTRRWAFGEPRTGSSDATIGLGIPRGLAVMDDGSVVVTDAFLFDLVVISPNGTKAQRFGERGTAPGQFNFANDVDAQGDLLLVADKENDRVAVLRMARP